MKIYIIIFILNYFSLTTLIAQHQCGTVFTEDDINEIIHKRKEGAKIRNSMTSKKSNQVLEFIIQPFIIIDDNTGTPSINRDFIFDIEQGINSVFFEDVGIFFEMCGPQDIECTTLFNIDLNQQHDLQSIIELGVHSTTDSRIINVFFCNELTTFQAAFLKGTNNIIVETKHENNSFYSIETISKLLIHEIGHYFGLSHTFAQDDNGNLLIPELTVTGEIIEGYPNPSSIELLSGGNCPTAADKFCGTKADYRLPFGNGADISTCGGVEETLEYIRNNLETWEDYDPPIDNYMSYYPNECKSKFTEDQILAIINYAEGINGTLTCPDPIPDSRIQDVCNNLDDSILAFECQGFCSESSPDLELSMACGALSGNIYNLTISLSNLQIKNNGTTAANNVDVQFSLINASENHIIGTRNIGTIAPDETAVPSLPVFYVNTIPDGSYNLKAKLIYGSGEYNSCISTDQIHIGGIPGGRGDLKFDLCGVIDALQNGFNIYFRVKNQGEITTPTTTVDIYLSDDEVFDDTDQFIKTRDIQELESGAYISSRPQFNLNGLDMSDGDSYILLVIDEDDLVTESDEDNNICAYQLNQCDSYSRNVNGNLTNDVEATSDITAPAFTSSLTNTTTISPSANVNFKAGKYIDLVSGFTAEYSSIFTAYIESCGIPSFDGTKVTTEQAPVTLRNYPNPFTGQTTIEYNIPNDSPVMLVVTDLTGKRIAILENNEQKPQGIHTVSFDGSSYPAGMYYYTIQAGEYLGTQKMILVK